jgi:NAD(P)H dehydrogenase (quinone)
MRVLVVYCHPDPDSLVSAARERALAGLARGRHDVRLTDLYAEAFVPELSAEEQMAHRRAGVAPDVRRHADDLVWAEALVLVYPTWWSGQPAMLKGWFDRVWAAGVAWEMPEGTSVPRPLLRRLRRIVVVATHGSPKYVNALEGEGGKRTVTRSLRAMCSRSTRTTWCAMYDVDRSDERARTAFLDRVERTLARL